MGLSIGVSVGRCVCTLYFVGRTVGRCLYIGVPVGTVGVSVGRCVCQ